MLCAPDDVREQRRIVQALNERRKIIESARRAAEVELAELHVLNVAVLEAAFSGAL